ncbi:MAG: methyltransferase domain-containing protein [Candidatus Korobacteraceae bacterium]
MIGPDLSQRSIRPELMDTESVSFAEFHDCLQTLSRINTFTLAYRPTLRWFDRVTAGADSPISVLDIGCGGGDMLRQIWQRAKQRNLQVELTGIDLNPWSKKSAEMVTPTDAPIRFETANLFSLYPGRRANIIVSSLFTHHLTDGELLRFIQWMDRHATRGWFINDLHRHAVPYFFIKYAVRWLCGNRLIRHDAPVSVARAFISSEWRQLLAQAGIAAERSSIEWFFPFRYGVAGWKT